MKQSGKVAFVFPGQGSQYVGMGKDLHAQFAAAGRVFSEADEALGFPLSQLCFGGPESDLKLTENTQPAILTVSVAALRVLESETSLRPDFVAGHSLGEYTSLGLRRRAWLPGRGQESCANGGDSCSKRCLPVRALWR